MLEQAAKGLGHIALVSGEAGAGKTTLIDAFIHSGASSARVLRGSCEDLSIADPQGPLYDLARHAQWALDTQSVERSRLSLFSQALDVFEMSEQPTVLAIEDVHWADDATLDFIRFIGRRIAGTHILLIVTARNDGSEGQRRVRRALADIPSDNLARIEVPLLSEAAVSQMAREAGQDGSAIYRATAGNAFFVSELLRAGRSGTVPPGVRDAVLARAERLSPAGRKALDAVSVFPRRAEAQAIFMMLGEEAENSLNECVATGMLSQAGSFYMFRHEIARSAVEAALTSRTRIS